MTLIESERREAINFAEGTAEVAAQFKCSPGLVYRLRKEWEAEEAAKRGSRIRSLAEINPRSPSFSTMPRRRDEMAGSVCSRFVFAI